MYGHTSLLAHQLLQPPTPPQITHQVLQPPPPPLLTHELLQHPPTPTDHTPSATASPTTTAHTPTSTASPTPRLIFVIPPLSYSLQSRPHCPPRYGPIGGHRHQYLPRPPPYQAPAPPTCRPTCLLPPPPHKHKTPHLCQRHELHVDQLAGGRAPQRLVQGQHISAGPGGSSGRSSIQKARHQESQLRVPEGQGWGGGSGLGFKAGRSGREGGFRREGGFSREGGFRFQGRQGRQGRSLGGLRF